MISTLENALVLTHFKELSKQNRNPQLAVYRNRYLILVSYESDSCLKKILQGLKNVWFAILTFFGALEVNEARINQLKTEVYQYHFRDAEENFLIFHSQKQNQPYPSQLTHLFLTKNRLISEIEKLTKNKEELAQEVEEIEHVRQRKVEESLAESEKLGAIQDQFTRAEQLIKQEDSLKKEIANLDEKKQRLEKEIPNLADELKRLKEELSHFQSELDQNKHRSQIEDLKNQNERLRQRLDNSESQKSYMQTQTQTLHQQLEKTRYLGFYRPRYF